MSMQSPTTPHHDRFPALATIFIERWGAFDGIHIAHLTTDEIAALTAVPRKTARPTHPQVGARHGLRCARSLSNLSRLRAGPFAS